jgi:hypothetical protein
MVEDLEQNGYSKKKCQRITKECLWKLQEFTTLTIEQAEAYERLEKFVIQSGLDPILAHSNKE